MLDREKVVKAIDICLGHGVCNDCPYCLSGKGYTTMNCRDYMLRDAINLLKEQETMNVDTFMQWCIDSHIMGDATVRGIKYWVEKFKEGR